VSDPIYIWNQTGSDAYTWSIGQSAWIPYVQLGRDIFVNMGAKPGYAKFTYPHPLRAVVERGGEPPTPPSPPSGLQLSYDRPGPSWLRQRAGLRPAVMRGQARTMRA
jgi:hypothetical protein